MDQPLSLIDAASLGDLKVYLGRAARIDNGSVRLIGGMGVLAAYTAALTPRGLLDDAPTVLGLRTFALGSAEAFDTLVGIRPLLDRLAQTSLLSNSHGGPIEVPLPPAEGGIAWAGISPPRGGWQRIGSFDPSVLETSAADGIAEVAATVPADPGEHVVHRVRSEVWGRPLPLGDPELPPIPSGTAFAAVSLGFVKPDDPVSVFVSGPWLRLTTRRGHVLARV
ncbi:hypothetical protein N1031_08545 [Herbiconiux moechotypicola]|uniref:Uncharacterized protein n=1 Tax=Herbiconiux moechotypicola TaxID=637393 RepID=A0ABP5QGJ0_9MICO|nr:hypothetical protein [Herbiconiux moechotypicola]MCS5729807.1 hypothetical protein [Herbiconiux moechotypicola]